jgi:hypothetical protein
MSDVTDPRLYELWTLRDFLRDNPTGFTTVTKTKIRRLERELRDEGIDTETRPPQTVGTRWVIFTSKGRDDLGGAQSTHADRHCHICEQYPGFVREATESEIARLGRCGFCG